MPVYEHTLIARQDITPQQVDAMVEEAKTILAEKGASVVKNEYWGLRNLAYRIKKNRKGHYAFLGVEGPAAAVQELERRLKINEDVLRFMTIKVEAIDLENPSAVLSKREERRRRDFDGPGGGRDDRPSRDDRPPRGDRDDRPPRGDRGDRDRS